VFGSRTLPRVKKSDNDIEMIQSSFPTLPSLNPEISSDTDVEHERRLFSIPLFSRRRCVVALYCLMCTTYIIIETRRAISATRTESIRESQTHIVSITVAPSPLLTSSSSHDRNKYGNESDNSKSAGHTSYDSMPACFGRPLEGRNVEARLIHIDRDEDDDGTLCPITDPFVAGKRHVTWGVDTDSEANVGETVISQQSKDYDGNDSDVDNCISDTPVALIASRGKCSFQAKAIEALHQNKHRNCHDAVSYLIIYDNQIEEQYHSDLENDNGNDKKSSPLLLRMSATDNDAKKLMEDMPISLFFVSYDTGMALKQAITDYDQQNVQNDGSDNSSDHDEETGLMVTFNPEDSLYRHHTYHPKHNFHNHNYYKKDRMNDTNNNHKLGDNKGNINDNEYYDPQDDPTKLLFVQMVTAMSLMFTFFVCIGCGMVCCCGHPDQEGGGWFTFHMDRNGFVFGRPDNGDGEGVVRLLTEEEVLFLQEVEFGVNYGKDRDRCFNRNNDDLEGGETKSMEVENRLYAKKKRSKCSHSSEMLLIQRNVNDADNNDTTTSPRPKTRTEPLQDQSSSLLNYDSLSWNAMCSICLEDYEQGEKLRMLPCHHMFHTECIVPWLTERFPNCPLCKAQVIAGQLNNGNDNLNDDDVGMVSTVGEHEGDEGVAMEQGERAIETNGAHPLVTSWRNFFSGGVVDSLSSEEDQTLSNLSTPLLQDSRIPARSLS